jgi:hypothetical protein
MRRISVRQEEEEEFAERKRMPPPGRRENIVTGKEGRKKYSYMYPETEEGRKDIYQNTIFRRFPRTSPQT